MVISEGKTKIIEHVEPGIVRLVSKDDITAGDGAKHDVLPGKGEIATETAANVFELLDACGMPVAYRGRDSANSLLAHECRMLPWEVVVRGEAHGSFLKRHPHWEKGEVMKPPLVEFFLKTNESKWREWDLPSNDPLALFHGDRIRLYEPGAAWEENAFFLELRPEDVFDEPADQDYVYLMRALALETFLILRKAWNYLHRNLVDMKVEFGVGSSDVLYLADVIDNDSWRLLANGRYMDKQVYRDGGALDEVLGKYREVAEFTRMFAGVRGQVRDWIKDQDLMPA